MTLALDITEKLGGVEILLDQFYKNTSWITKPDLPYDENQEK